MIINLIVDELSKAKAAGIAKVSIKQIIGVIRWNMSIQTRSSDYKINDAFTSLYAILVDANFPEFSGMFEQRELRCISKK